MESEYFNDPGGEQKTQSTALEVAGAANELQISSAPENEVLLAVKEYLPVNAQEAIKSDIQRLQEQRANSVAELRNNGNLPAEIAAKCEALMRGRSVNTESLTVRQTAQVYDFVMETTAGVRYEKGARLYKMLNEAVGTEVYRAGRSYSRIGMRRMDEMPEYGAYDDTDDFDRSGYTKTRIRISSLRERYSEQKYIFEGKDPISNHYENRAPRDEFTKKIGAIALKHMENQRYDETVSGDNINLMYGRDLERAIHENPEENGKDEDAEYDESGDLLYDMFSEADLALAEEKIELRRDINDPTANDLHTERLREIYNGSVTDLFDQLDAGYIEEVIGENRLTAKSAVALGLGAVERAMAARKFAGAKILNLSGRVTAQCRQLLNISGNPGADAMEKYEKRGANVWTQVNRGVNNLRIIDNLIQNTHELTVLLDLQKAESGAMLSDGSNGEATE